jgi:hypothetical protein
VSAISLSSNAGGAISFPLTITCASGLTAGAGCILKGGAGDYILFTGCEL